MTSNRLERRPERSELAEFVRFCRERASPADLGLPATRRRRTQGLRREEVAALAGVGLTWYTWFEQGRDIQVSDDFLNRFARGLKLARAEREHLFALSGRSIVAPDAPGAAVPLALAKLVEALPKPAYVINQCWDVLAFNDAACNLFEELAQPHPNLLRIVFFSSAYRDKVRSWEAVARPVFLKARHDYLTGGRSPALRALLDEIMAALSEAKAWWEDSEVARIGDMQIDFRDPEKDWQSYHLSILAYEDRPSLRLVAYTT